MKPEDKFGLRVFDFDGTITDLKTSGLLFERRVLAYLAQNLHLPIQQIESQAQAFRSEMKNHPERFVWKYGEHITSSALADPYLRAQALAKCISTLHSNGEGVPHQIFKRLYSQEKIHVAPWMQRKLAALHGTGATVYVVTNSEAVNAKAMLKAWHASHDRCSWVYWLLPRIRGNAQKQLVDDTFDLVPSKLDVPGFTHPVLLRRREYYKALDKLRKRLALTWDQICVTGDNLELDLALPLALGTHVELVSGVYTSGAVRDFVGRHPRGKVLGLGG